MGYSDTEIRYLKGIGEKKAEAFNRLGVYTLRDLLSLFPRKYEDRSRFTPIAAALDGESVCIKALVASEPRLSRVRRGLELVKFRVVDDSAAVDITYFNQPYIRQHIHKGDLCRIYGRIVVVGGMRTMTNPVYEAEGSIGSIGGIVPVYPLTSGLNQKLVSSAVRQALDACADELPDALPEKVREEYRLAQSGFAYENIHLPSDFEALELARRRLVFEELFVLACAMKKLKNGSKKAEGKKIIAPDPEEFFGTLPFEPTGAQRRAINDALCDMASGGVMNRLVQGDVGSGKTLVAAALIWAAAKNGLGSAFMAPTEILAQQHYQTLSGLLDGFGIRIVKLTGAMTAKEKREAKAELKAGGPVLAVGTHALFSKDVEYENLGLVITDEQHRFGVNQRASLIEKGARPHVLVMSATPIPRTLALIIYGDLDVSVIDELPPGRQAVETVLVTESLRLRLNAFIRKLVGEGRQVFVVCPMIEESDAEQQEKLRSAEEHARELQRYFPNMKVACIHGRMKAKDKNALMEDFVAGRTDILVSTTVIEVGVDVPNAALMIIENAERFGLSQLHQLRGRVGRGEYKSYCVLVSDSDNETSVSRLRVMTKTSDGFKVSEEDLKLRGPGDFFGSRQHGLPEMHIADLCADMNVLQTAQTAANELTASDPDLCKPENEKLSLAVKRLFEINTDTLN